MEAAHEAHFATVILMAALAPAAVYARASLTGDWRVDVALLFDFFTNGRIEIDPPDLTSFHGLCP